MKLPVSCGKVRVRLFILAISAFSYILAKVSKLLTI